MFILTQIKIFLCFFVALLFPSLVIRGEKDEQAVLCSKDKTYDMKIADTSNMLLFIPGCKTPEQLKADQASCNIIHSQVRLSGFLLVCFNSLLSYSLKYLIFYPRCICETWL